MTGKQVIGLFKDYWWILGLVVLLIALALTLGYCERRTIDKLNQIESNIDQQKGVNSVIEVQRNTSVEEVTNAQTTTNNAINTMHNSNARDSSTFAGNAHQRFCERYPTDSTCK